MAVGDFYTDFFLKVNESTSQQANGGTSNMPFRDLFVESVESVWAFFEESVREGGMDFSLKNGC